MSRSSNGRALGPKGIWPTKECLATIDGQGYSWWWLFLLGRLPLKRPTMVYMTGGSNVLVANITLMNQHLALLVLPLHARGLEGLVANG